MHKINSRIYFESNGAMAVPYSTFMPEYGEWCLIVVERGIAPCR